MTIWRFSFIVQWWNEGAGWIRAVIGLVLAQVFLLILIATRAGIKLYRQGQRRKSRPTGALDEDHLPQADE